MWYNRAMITVTKTVKFDAAHILTNHCGLCKNLHGHTYRVDVSVTQSEGRPGDMVIDFKDLKNIAEEVICASFDHAFIYNTTSAGECEIAAVVQKHGMRTVALPFRSTAENLAKYFHDELRRRIPEASSVKVWETEASCAEYHEPPRILPSFPFLKGRIDDSVLQEGLHPRFAKAFAFLRRPDLADLPIGRHEIDGDDCWAIVSDVDLKPFGDSQRAEVHRTFIDIQVPIDGPETYGLLDLAGRNLGPFDEEKDIAFGQEKMVPLTLVPGEYAIFMPVNGAHAPCLTLGGPTRRKKLIVKVRASVAGARN